MRLTPYYEQAVYCMDGWLQTTLNETTLTSKIRQVSRTGGGVSIDLPGGTRRQQWMNESCSCCSRHPAVGCTTIDVLLQLYIHNTWFLTFRNNGWMSLNNEANAAARFGCPCRLCHLILNSRSKNILRILWTEYKNMSPCGHSLQERPPVGGDRGFPTRTSPRNFFCKNMERCRVSTDDV